MGRDRPHPHLESPVTLPGYGTRLERALGLLARVNYYRQVVAAERSEGGAPDPQIARALLISETALNEFDATHGYCRALGVDHPIMVGRRWAAAILRRPRPAP